MRNNRLEACIGYYAYLVCSFVVTNVWVSGAFLALAALNLFVYLKSD